MRKDLYNNPIFLFVNLQQIKLFQINQLCPNF